ncbi:hypothetical protein IWW36_006230, partial [Coemansia brasiliensis]
MTVDHRAAAQVRKIAADLSANEQHIVYTSLLSPSRPKLNKGSSFSNAWATLWQAPTQALTHSLFGRSTATASNRHLHPVDCTLLETTKQQQMVWLAWDDCRSLFQVFRHLEYVDNNGKPTSLVDSFVSRITDGEAANLSPAGRVNSNPVDSDTDG